MNPINSSIWPRTNWPELDKAAQNLGRNSDLLDKLIRVYWGPLKVYFSTAFPSLRDHAEEVLQDFSQDKILRTGWLRKADPDRGRFRDFLKRSLRNFVLDRLNRAEARNAPLSLEGLEQEVPEPEHASDEFDLAWIRTILAETLRRMEDDCRNPGSEQPRRSYIWELFQIRIMDHVLNDTTQVPYEELVERFGLRSPTEASNLLLSAKRIFTRHLNEVIKEYAEHDKATAMEIQDLKDYLGRLGSQG